MVMPTPAHMRTPMPTATVIPTTVGSESTAVIGVVDGAAVAGAEAATTVAEATATLGADTVDTAVVDSAVAQQLAAVADSVAAVVVVAADTAN